EGEQIRHGIFRDFPTTYTGARGTRVVVGFDVLSVTRDGNREEFKTEHVSNGVRVRIGSADQLIPQGPHTFVIRYRTTRPIGVFKEDDELYWNATGTGWPFEIDVAQARIRLPEPVRFTGSTFYTGPQGADGKNAQVVSEAPGEIVFRTTQPLPPH